MSDSRAATMTDATKNAPPADGPEFTAEMRERLWRLTSMSVGAREALSALLRAYDALQTRAAAPAGVPRMVAVGWAIMDNAGKLEFCPPNYGPEAARAFYDSSYPDKGPHRIVGVYVQAQDAAPTAPAPADLVERTQSVVLQAAADVLGHPLVNAETGRVVAPRELSIARDRIAAQHDCNEADDEIGRCHQAIAALTADRDRLKAAAVNVIYFDWSDNDSDAVASIEYLRKAVAESEPAP